MGSVSFLQDVAELSQPSSTRVVEATFGRPAFAVKWQCRYIKLGFGIA